MQKNKSKDIIVFKDKLKAIAQRAAVIFVWLAIWQLVSLLVGKNVLLPSPRETFIRLCNIAMTADMWSSVGSTLLRILAGFTGGMAAGCILGAATYRLPYLKSFFQPLLVISKTTPVASFIILALVIIPTSAVPSFTVMMITMPVFWSNIYSGAGAVDKELLEMARAFRFGKKQLIKSIYIPSLIPYYRSAVTTGIGLAWKSGIAAEVICMIRSSVGGKLYYSKIYLETDNLFAWTAVVILLSILLEKAVVALINAVFAKREVYL